MFPPLRTATVGLLRGPLPAEHTLAYPVPVSSVAPRARGGAPCPIRTRDRPCVTVPASPVAPFTACPVPIHGRRPPHSGLQFFSAEFKMTLFGAARYCRH